MARAYNEFTRVEQLRAATRGDPLLSFNWAITGLIPFADVAGIDHTYIESIEIPFVNINVDQIFASGRYFSRPMHMNISAFTVNVYADAFGKGLNWLMTWKKKVIDPSTGFHGLPGDYTRDMEASLFDVTGKTTHRAKLIGTWPADTSAIQLQYNASDRLVYSQNFAIDDMQILPPR